MNQKTSTPSSQKTNVPPPSGKPPITTSKANVDAAVATHAAVLGKVSDPATTTAVADAAQKALDASKGQPPAGKPADKKAPAADKSKLGPGIISRGNSYRVDPTKIDRKAGWNPRFDMGDIATLALSIEANGVKRPLLVKRVGERFELVDGDRRLTAVESLLKKGVKFPDGIPAEIAARGMTDTEAMVSMILANDGKPFLPLEEAAAYKKMRDSGGANGGKMTIKAICDAVGRKPVHVNQMLALVEADDSVKAALAAGKIGKQTAKDIATKAKGDKSKQVELTRRAVTARGDKKEAQKARTELKATKKPKKQRTRRQLSLSVTHDYMRTLETRSHIKLKSLLDAIGLKDGTEIKANSRAEKSMLMCGFIAGIRAASSANDKACHEVVTKPFTQHGIE